MLIAAQEYRRWDGVEMARLVRAGEVSPADLAETARGLIADLPALNAVADTVAEAPAEPTVEGPLAGVPFAVKELLAWPGLPWTMGSRLMSTNPAPGVSPYAARLQEAGLAVLCSTTSSEFGLLGSTESALRGPTLNPWGEGLSAGGSSGGSAALVAAGFVPLAHGNDAGGSLRVPASLTGLFGFKPSNLRTVPSGPELPGLPALVVEHCISRSVRDSAHLLAATERTGPDAVHPPVGLVTGPDGARLRIAVLTQTLTGREPEDAVAREVARAAELCAALGHHVEAAPAQDVDGDALSRAFFSAAARTMTDVAAMVTPLLGRPPGPAELEPFTLELIDWAAGLGPTARADGERAFTDATRARLALFEHCDVVLSPTLARVCWPLGHLSPAAGRETLIRRTEEAVGYTPMDNIAGCPAMSVPLGRSGGLPVGVHFAARPGADRLLLALAHELEAAAPWADVQPDVAWLAGRS
ncbi:amidase family protein [Modestobacter sp. VKM Ac-2978]|uniref:amidase family protein n=1 Tax=Modestobacter sp. VKM Ac-2978 TaxID=3004132 RepID=UPI0022AAFE19|nr:amidase family protein [Modestobacter sp. VKM Ac-2978]MCZ2847805.1 amidase family protein [Modestobacter sp. VKM Ac-2978]